MTPVRKNGIVLEGGGMRGGYTAGVLDAFIENGITFDYCIGVSAGACNALSFIGRQKGRYIRANTEYLNDPRYMGLHSLLKTGYFLGNRFIFDDITDTLVPLDFDAFHKGLQTCPFVCVTTDCETGLARYDEITDLQAQRALVEASSSLPLISPTIPYDGHFLMDGGVADSIPLKRAQADGCRKCVVILTQDASYRKKKNKLMMPLRLKYGKRFPNMVKALERRYLSYNETLDYVESEKEAGRAFVIQPGAPVTVGRMERNRDNIMALYQTGYLDGLANIAKVKAFLSSEESA